MNKVLFSKLLIILLQAYSIYGIAQTQDKITIPKYNDTYGKTVAKLESGQTDIDYKDFRFSFLESKQYDFKNKNFALFDSLRGEMFKQVKDKNYKNVIAVSKRILSIDYTFLYAQKYLYQSYRIIGDSINMRKYKSIEMGLLKSIVSNGDGQSCVTYWEASQVNEEYFILDMIDATLIEQSIIKCTGHLCDDMEVTKENGDTMHYYFEINKMLEATSERLDAK